MTFRKGYLVGGLMWLALVATRPAAAAPLDATRVNGSYDLKAQAMSGTMSLELVSASKIHVSFDLYFSGTVTSGSGSGEGDAVVKGNVATATLAPGCTMTLKFGPLDTVDVTQHGSGMDCNFYSHVSADGTYHKTRGGKPSRTPLPSGPNPDLRALNAVVSETEQELSSLPALVQAERQGIDQLAAERKSLLAAVQAKKHDFDKQASTATAALKRYQSAAKAAKPPTKPSLPELLAAAQTETPPALRLGRELVKSDVKLRDLEDRLAQLATEAKQAATDAKLALGERQKATGALSASAKKAGVKPDAQALAAAKKSDADARANASAVASSASAAQTAAGVSLPTFSTHRAQGEKEIHQRLEQIKGFRTQLDALKLPQPAAAAAAAPVPAKAIKQCDLAKVDWSTWFPPQSTQTDDGEDNYGIESIDYGDLDGDGHPEALVRVAFSHAGATFSEHWELHVMTRKSDCTVVDAGNLDGFMCSDAVRSGIVIKFDDGCDGYSAEYKLVQGKLKETKRVANQ